MASEVLRILPMFCYFYCLILALPQTMRDLSSDRVEPILTPTVEACGVVTTGLPGKSWSTLQMSFPCIGLHLGYSSLALLASPAIFGYLSPSHSDLSSQLNYLKYLQGGQLSTGPQNFTFILSSSSTLSTSLTFAYVPLVLLMGLSLCQFP